MPAQAAGPASGTSGTTDRRPGSREGIGGGGGGGRGARVGGWGGEEGTRPRVCAEGGDRAGRRAAELSESVLDRLLMGEGQGWSRLGLKRLAARRYQATPGLGGTQAGGRGGRPSPSPQAQPLGGPRPPRRPRSERTEPGTATG